MFSRRRQGKQQVWNKHQGWTLRSFEVEGSGDDELGVDIVDNHASDEVSEHTLAGPRNVYAATMLRVREGGAVHSAHAMPDGIIVAIEGKHLCKMSFIETVHILKEVALLRPFSVILAYRENSDTDSHKDVEWTAK